MNTLYLIGGSPRSGKTLIFKEVIKRNPMIAISSDALREAIRFTVTEESFINIHELAFEGDVTFHRAGEDGNISHTKYFSQKPSQEELTWKTIQGLIQYYDHNENRSLIIEGMAITPERVKSLNLKNMKLKAVFVGFTDPSHLDSILKYAYENEDWVHTKITKENGGDDTSVREWFNAELEQNNKVEALAKEYGYGFFSPHGGKFDAYCDEVVKYLLD